MEEIMTQPERFDSLILGNGNGGMYLAWHLGRSGRRTAMVERRWIGGSCRNINCLPTKNEIWSARAIDFARHGANYGAKTGPVTVDMAKVRQRKREMVEEIVDLTLRQYEATGVDLVRGTGHFTAPKTLEVQLNDGGTRLLTADQVFVNLGTHGAIPAFPASRKPGR
jgi:pyruvate/2-oxoglutarate dehydrogenase complex dihydrolipoamide dehydrogenase (E3) component